MPETSVLKEILVTIRPAIACGNLKAWVDVTIDLGKDGRVILHDCSVVSVDGKAPFVAYPQKKGTSKWFPIVTVEGNLFKTISAVVLKEYDTLK